MVGLNKPWMSFIKKIMQKLDVTNEHYWLVVYLPPWKICSSVGMMTLPIYHEKKSCSKPPTRHWDSTGKSPSGNLLHSYWKWLINSWFTYSKWWFSIVLLVYQRVWMNPGNISWRKPDFGGTCSSPTSLLRRYLPPRCPDGRLDPMSGMGSGGRLFVTATKCTIMGNHWHFNS